MDPVSLIPAPDVLPAHWIFLQVLLSSTAFLHFSAMNIMLGVGVIILLAPYSPADPAPLRRDMSKLLPYSIAFTINFGVAPLLFLQVLYGQFLYTSSVLMAVLWLTIVGLLITTYYLTYLYKYNSDSSETAPLYLGAAIFLLLVVGLLFTNAISLMQDPPSWSRYFTSRHGNILNLADPAFIPRYLHFILSAIAMGGLAIAFYYKVADQDKGADSKQWIRYGCNLFSLMTIANFGVGFWFMGKLPPELYSRTGPSGTLFYILLIGSILTICLGVVAAQRSRIIAASVWTLTTILLMTILRDVVRIGYLDQHLDLSSLPLSGQYWQSALFLGFMGVAVYLCVWMIKLVMRDQEVNR